LDKTLIIYNIDPTPGNNAIISQSGEVGHTWLSVDGDHYGWGYSGDPSSGNTVSGFLLDSEEANLGGGTITSQYTKTVTDEQGDAIVGFYNNLQNTSTGYNLGGLAKDPLATMCTESVVNALNSAGALTPAESAIINAPYAPWSNSFPSNIPSGFQAMAPSVAGLTSPNPNAFEDRMNLLNNQPAANQSSNNKND